jgi:hypothetical protein
MLGKSYRPLCRPDGGKNLITFDDSGSQDQEVMAKPSPPTPSDSRSWQQEWAAGGSVPRHLGAGQGLAHRLAGNAGIARNLTDRPPFQVMLLSDKLNIGHLEQLLFLP